MTDEGELSYAGTVAKSATVPCEGLREVGIDALQEHDQADQAWLACARNEAESGFAALDRGEGLPGNVDEHMARIDAAVRARVASTRGQ